MCMQSVCQPTPATIKMQKIDTQYTELQAVRKNVPFRNELKYILRVILRVTRDCTTDWEKLSSRPFPRSLPKYHKKEREIKVFCPGV